MKDSSRSDLAASIAVIGMAGRFPGARNVPELWQNLTSGVESISHFRPEELENATPELLSNPNYVKSRSVLDDVDLFDAGFFEMYPKEAEITDPQHRIFLECSWQALEDAGYDPHAYKGAIGVFAGCSMNTYFLSNLCARSGYIKEFANSYQVGSYPDLVGNGHDFLATRVSYKLNLRGPSFTLQAGCATSLLAICQAYQSLVTYQSDMALAGGVSITFPQKRGYLYQEDGMVSPDGHCRTFDAKAKGTIFGSGVGVVVLKRLEDAHADGDRVYAVIRGLAVNNDGNAKVGYAAPSVEGQSEVIATAHAAADVSAETIGYVEAHGTGTPLGDPIEIAALTKAFRATTQAKNFCAIGAVKPNLGHLDVAAGVTGFIKTVLALHHKILPPMLHFEQPNPRLDLANSPFYVNTKLSQWKNGNYPRRAGVSAFGVGGTNAHVVLEEAPKIASSRSRRGSHLLLLSGKTESALAQATVNLAAHLKKTPELDLADAAYTLQAGRKHFPYRGMLVCGDSADAINALEHADSKRLVTRKRLSSTPSIGFMFPGQGSQYVGMGSELYATESVFRQQMDCCAEILRAHAGLDLRGLIYPSAENREVAKARLNETLITQPAIFSFEYALASLWMSWGILPQAMVGHSVGEFVAACLAGVFSLEDALSLVARRARMMQELPGGAMLAVRLGVDELRELKSQNLSIAAINAPQLTVVAGPEGAIQELETALAQKAVASKRLATSHAFHSQMVDPIIQRFTELVQGVTLKPPAIPYVSCVTGTWITDAEAIDPVYWARHAREPVRFVDAIQLVKTDVLLEVGAGKTLEALARQATSGAERIVVSSVPDSSIQSADVASMFNALGRLWLAGVEPNWHKVYSGEQRLRVSLPSYPFQRQRYWLEPAAPRNSKDPAAESEREQKTRDESMMVMKNTTNSIPGRQDRIRSVLASIFEELSGLSAAEIPDAAAFLELGFDSLLLTQVSQALQSKFGLKITFRQLLDQLSSLSALAAHLDANLPPEAFVVEPEQVEVAVSGPEGNGLKAQDNAVAALTALNGQSSSFAAAEGLSERILKEQLRTMSELMAAQLQLLKGHSGTVRAALPPANMLSITNDVKAALSAALAIEIKTPPSVPSQSESSSNEQEFKAFGPYKPVQQGRQGGLTARQEKYLTALIARYTKRTAESKRLTQSYREPLADPRVVAGFRSQWKEIVYPIVTMRSAGSKLWDVDGNEYIDILNGYGPTMFGHAPKFVTDAVAEQLKLGFEIGPQSPLAGKVAALISEFTGMERVTFCNTGSEAVMAALRLARTVTGRNKIVMFAGSYHGTFDEVLVKGVGKGGTPRSVPIAPGIPKEKVENVVVLEYGSPESLAFIKAHAQELAAVLVEPVQSRHPALQPREFLTEVRKITSETGTALIFDEVVTGFRSHPGGVQALFGIKADLATYGKVLAGGLPIGVLAGSRKFMDALDGGSWTYGDESFPETGVTFFAGTFVRHPLALAATFAVLNHLKTQGPELQRRLTDATAELVRILNEFCEQYGVPTRIETFASIFYFSFPADLRFGSLFYYHMRERGIHIQEGFPCFLTTAHTEEDIARIIHAFKESIKEMQAGEVLPAPASFALQPSQENEPATKSLAPGPDASGKAPLTEAQMEIWLSAQLSPEASCSYNESFSLRLTGPLDQAALRDSLQEIVDRHDALRMSFSVTGDSLLFRPHLALDVKSQNLSSEDETSREDALRQLIHEDARTPFDLVEGPLVRTFLAKLSTNCHVLVFTAHHIVCDGWSVNVILDELAKLYSSKCRRVPCELPAPASFAAYAKTQANQIGSPEAATIEAYWLAKFASLPPVLELPTDRPRAALKTYHGATHRSVIAAESYRKIKRAGAQHGCTLFVTLLAGFHLLLRRLTSQEEIVVGIPAAGQSLLGASPLVGHCVNFLPQVETTSATTRATDMLAQVKRTVLDAYDHQNYTFGTLVRKLSIARNASRLPLVEVQFNLEQVGGKLDFAGVRAEVDPNPKSYVNFDLFLNAVESDQGLVVDCDYNTDLFDESTIARWMDCYRTLLEAIAEDASRPVSALPLLRQEELDRIVYSWNDTTADYPKQKTVHQLFEEQAARTPDAIALEFEEKKLTYRELDHKANQLAHYLRAAGVGPDILVGLLAERSAEMVVGLLGVLKAGGAYVPMDPTYPNDRVAFILGEAKVGVLLTFEPLNKNLDACGARVVCLDADWSVIERESTAQPPVSATAENLAYVIYTSGSTGKPKGVAVGHRSVVNLLCSMQRQPGISQQDTLLAVTTLSFDIAGLELYLPLCTGARLVVATRETASDGSQLLAKLRSSGATLLQATPVSWRLLLDAGWKGDPRLTILCGGEALPRDLANQLLETGCPLWNMYGPTETTIWSSTSRVQSGDGPVLLGPPIANTQFYVLDSAGQPVPIGVYGELHIGGDGLARGYFKRPDLTHEKFIADPFRKEANARIYKTGDLVRYLPDGTLEFLGRLDHQVKLRGFRVELGEIESVLAQHPKIRESAVIVREDTPGDKRLVAYLVANSEASPDAAELRSFLSAKLPDYMIPSAFVNVLSIPLTANGKVDRRALPAPDWKNPLRQKEIVAPRTEQEQALAGIWADVLHLECVGVHDNIFELGADSLHVFQIAARANKAGLQVTPRLLLQHRTIAAIVAEMGASHGHGNGHGNGAKPAAPAIAPVSRERFRVKHQVQ